MIGANGLDLVAVEPGIVQNLGSVGLLYLMFSAALEIDLGLFRKVRTQAIGIAVLTYSGPAILGYALGLALGFSTRSAILLGGAILPSFTPLVHPALCRLGLGRERAVISTLAAVVGCDSAAMLVLAFVTDRSKSEGPGRIVAGFVLLVVGCFVVLRVVGRWYFPRSSSITQQYLFLVVCLLSASVLSESVGIEPMVGAFFAGLSLSSYVPRHGSLLGQVEFFGTVIFFPMFLVAVGTRIDPGAFLSVAVLARGGLIALITLSGKALGALLCRPLFGYSNAETGLVFSIASSKVAATLAATLAGIEAGLLRPSELSAVMVVIVVTVTVASICARTFGGIHAMAIGIQASPRAVDIKFAVRLHDDTQSRSRPPEVSPSPLRDSIAG